MRFLLAIIAALAHMTGQGLTWCWNTFLSVMPGGRSGPAAPRPLEKILPDADDVKDVKAEVINRHRAVEALADDPLVQIRRFIQAHEHQRESIPLTRLSTEQQIWLADRSEEELQLMNDAPARKLFDALTGKEDAIPGVTSFGIKKGKPGPLTDRVMLFRNGNVDRQSMHTAH